MTRHHTTLNAVLSVLEILTEKILAADPGTQTALNRLAGKTLALVIENSGLTAYVHFTPNRIELLSHFEGTITTTLTGTPRALLRLIFTPTTTLYKTGVQVTGSTSLLTSLQLLSHNIELDWEDIIGQYLGILPAHGIAKTIEGAANWQHARGESFSRLIGEYLTEELNAVVGHAELQGFSADVDALRSSLDRFEARLQQYKATILETHRDK